MNANCCQCNGASVASTPNRSKLLEFEAWPDIKEYHYDPLPADKKRIRLLRLLPGVLESPQIDCEIFEAQFDSKGRLLKVKPHKEDGQQNGRQDAGETTPERPNREDETGGLNGVMETNDDDVMEKEEAEPTPEEIVAYEALTWRWGDEDRGRYTIMIMKDGQLYKKRVSETLGLALKYLRLQTDRILWIDAICINQKDLEERSYQVSMMSLVYTGAKEVCVWLGEDDEKSRLAIRFIQNEISPLKNFDTLCTDKQHAEKWRALLMLMQSAWFSRRWVVQEIALAQKAAVYCGPDKISWGDLAIAVELFVEVETATHRLSELMKKDDKVALVPYWFEHVSELGASVLVNATARVFREHRRGGYGPLTLTSETLSRRSLLSLEYLVTSLSIFDCGRPHDSVYALLAIARDAAPHPPSSFTKRTNEALIAEVFSDALEQKPYPLDYNSPYPDVCKEFTHFCIKQGAKSDDTQALDILCRPWAKDWRPKEYTPLFEETTPVPETIIKHEGRWMIRRSTPKENDSNSDSHQDDSQPMLEEDNRSTKEYMEDAERAYPTRPIIKRWFPKDSDSGSTRSGSNSGDAPQHSSDGIQDIDDLCLPSWIATTAGASFDIFLHPGMDMVKMGRKNADPLVGIPEDGHRNYNAGQSIGVDLETLKFRKRARLGHYSLYVKGFRFDKVKDVAQVSQAGAIPASWLDLAGWSKARRSRGPHDDPGDPPDELWRTLVADRGMHNRNPPYYYMRACKETIMKGGLRSNAVDTGALIYNERNSIIAEFCRRVQAVIWNRALIRTEKGALGLASECVKKGDWICIIYGCTVPVILRPGAWKTEKERKDEQFEDSIEALARLMGKAAKQRARKARYSQKSKKPGWKTDVEAKLRKFNEEHRSESSSQRDQTNGREPSLSESQTADPMDDTDEDKSDDENNATDKMTKRERKEAEERQLERDKERQKQANRKDPYRHFTLLGEAYIHGMMDGEAIRQKFRKVKPEHVFEIR